MKNAPAITELQPENIVLELKSIDQMYLDAYAPNLTSEKGIAGYFGGFLSHRFPATKSAAGKSECFVREIKKFIAGQQIEPQTWQADIETSLEESNHRELCPSPFRRQWPGQEGERPSFCWPRASSH
jgi:hypothetical protein